MLRSLRLELKRRISSVWEARQVVREQLKVMLLQYDQKQKNNKYIAIVKSSLHFFQIKVLN